MKPARLLSRSAFALAIVLPLIARADLTRDIGAVLANKYFAKARVAVNVVRLDAEKAIPLFRVNGDLPLAPASNMKLLTSSAILDQFGADFKFRTFLVRHGNDLILVGDGDPTFGDSEYLGKFNWTVTTVFENWASELKKAGLTSFDNVVVDDSVFDEVFVHPHWDVKQLNSGYSAEIAGMTLDAGCIEFRIQPTRNGLAAFTTTPATGYVTVRNSCGNRAGTPFVTRHRDSNVILLTGGCSRTLETSVTVHDPSMYAATVLAETLKRRGIKLSGKVLRDRSIRPKLARSDPDYKLLLMHETTLIDAVTHANKESQNLYTESFCKRLGASMTGQSGSWKNGTEANAAFLTKLGVDVSGFVLDDGCGLSHENRISADAFIRILERDFYGRNRDAYIATLPVAGRDGTLKERFKRSDLRGRVFAKTGFIDTVSALSGYLKAKDGRFYAFSILMNGLPRKTNSRAKELQEAIVKAIDNNTASTSR